MLKLILKGSQNRKYKLKKRCKKGRKHFFYLFPFRKSHRRATSCHAFTLGFGIFVIFRSRIRWENVTELPHPIGLFRKADLETDRRGPAMRGKPTEWGRIYGRVPRSRLGVQDYGINYLNN